MNSNSKWNSLRLNFESQFNLKNANFVNFFFKWKNPLK